MSDNILLTNITICVKAGTPPNKVVDKALNVCYRVNTTQSLQAARAILDSPKAMGEEARVAAQLRLIYKL